MFKAVHKPTGEEVAVKVLTESKPEEVALLQMCRECPEIVQCRASFKNPRADSIWVLLPSFSFSHFRRWLTIGAALLALGGAGILRRW